MKVQNINNVNFKMNIKVVSPKDYDRINDELAKTRNMEEVFNWEIVPAGFLENRFRAYRTDVDLASTDGVRSCTGGVIRKDNKASVFFHIGDTRDNLKNINCILPFMQGESAFMVGARSKYDYSGLLFNKLRKFINEDNKIPLTYMEDFNDHWEAGFTYDALKDELILCVKDILNPKKYVKNMEELLGAFKKVVVSPNDTIEFLQESVRKIAPSAKNMMGPKI